MTIIKNGNAVPDYYPSDFQPDLQDEIEDTHNAALMEIYDQALELPGDECERIMEALQDIIDARKDFF